MRVIACNRSKSGKSELELNTGKTRKRERVRLPGKPKMGFLRLKTAKNRGIENFS